MKSNTQIHTVYKTKAGLRVPSVTTYLGILNKPAIVHWAWELGVAGLDYRKVREQAGDTGTLVHYLILCYLKDVEPFLQEYTQSDITSTFIPMDKFAKWTRGKTIESILLETPLVSETYQYGGTPDFYGNIDGILTLLDFKTSGAVYPENFYQLAAYRKLLEEYGYEVEESKIIRVGKSLDEGFEEQAVGNLEAHWQIFLACQQIYELQKEAKRGAKKVNE